MKMNILKLNYLHSKHSQAHWLVAQADSQPKPAKELALPTRGQTGIKHETLTTNISKLGVSGLIKVCTFNKTFNGLTGDWLRNPSQLILATL